jgi:hypothetical protein
MLNEKREARRVEKQARWKAERRRVIDDLERGNDPVEFTETTAGYEARDRWARRYDDLNGAPEGEWDR